MQVHNYIKINDNLLLIISLLVLIVIACSQKEDKKIEIASVPMLKYFVDFNTDDCQSQLLKAKKAVDKGQLIYQIHTAYFPRYEEEFETLLANQGIEYINSGPNCTLEQECFGYYMDSIIHEKFGKNFIYKMERKADSLYFLNVLQSFAISWDCDEKPFHKTGGIGQDNGLMLKVPYQVKSNKRTRTTVEGIKMLDIEQPFMDITFIINKDGSLSDFEIENFIYYVKENLQFEQQLFEFSIQKIKSDFKDWIPGKINGQAVNTKYFLRVEFVNENSF